MIWFKIVIFECLNSYIRMFIVNKIKALSCKVGRYIVLIEIKTISSYFPGTKLSLSTCSNIFCKEIGILRTLSYQWIHTAVTLIQ